MLAAAWPYNTKTMTKPLGQGAWDKKITKYIIGALAET